MEYIRDIANDIKTCANQGIVSGESTMTRAQACAVIVRVMNLINS